MEKLLKQSGKGRITNIDKPTQILTASKTLAVTDAGKDFHIGTDGLTITLPAITAAMYGITYGFTNIGADGNNVINISPATADGMHGTITLAASVVELSGTANKDLINTKASATTGNHVLIQATSIGWFVKYSTGIWASE